MKRAVLLILCLLLVSCGEVREDYFNQPRILQITFEQNGTFISGRLETSSEEICFRPDSPEGVIIRIGKNGGKVSCGDITFEGVSERSRLTAFREQLAEGTLVLTFNEKPYPETIEGKDFKITVHKELNQ